MKRTKAEVSEANAVRAREQDAHESLDRVQSWTILTVFATLLSTLIGSTLAITSLFDWRVISSVFEEFGSLSEPLKFSVGIILGVLITKFVHRSLHLKMRRIDKV